LAVVRFGSVTNVAASAMAPSPTAQTAATRVARRTLSLRNVQAEENPAEFDNREQQDERDQPDDRELDGGCPALSAHDGRLMKSPAR
jgi:hypothetical protein